MGRIEDLAAVYKRHVSVPWQRTLAGAQRVMLVVYEKELERTPRAHVGEFKQATERSRHRWTLVDCTRWFTDLAGPGRVPGGLVRKSGTLGYENGTPTALLVGSGSWHDERLRTA